MNCYTCRAGLCVMCHTNDIKCIYCELLTKYDLVPALHGSLDFNIYDSTNNVYHQRAAIVDEYFRHANKDANIIQFLIKNKNQYANIIDITNVPKHY